MSAESLPALCNRLMAWASAHTATGRTSMEALDVLRLVAAARAGDRLAVFLQQWMQGGNDSGRVGCGFCDGPGGDDGEGHYDRCAGLTALRAWKGEP